MLNSLREKRSKIVADMQVLAAKAEKSAEEKAKFDAINAEQEELRSEIHRLEVAEALAAEQRSANRPPMGQPGFATDNRSDEEVRNDIFSHYLRTREVRTAGPTGLTITPGANGGYNVPTLFRAELESATLAWGSALSAVRQLDYASGAPLQWPMSNDTNNFSTVIGEATAASSLLPVFSQATLTVDTLSTGMIPVSRQLAQDSAIPINSIVTPALAERMFRGVNKYITNGSPTGNIQGLLSAGTIGAGATVTAVGTGATVAKIAYQDLLDLYGKIDPSYRQNAKFMMSNATWVSLMGLTDNYGRPLLQTNLNGQPFMSIFGADIVLNQDFPTVAAGAPSILFGDYSKYILRNSGVEILSSVDRYIESGQVVYLGFHRHAGVYLNAGTNPIVKLVQAAS